MKIGELGEKLLIKKLEKMQHKIDKKIEKLKGMRELQALKNRTREQIDNQIDQLIEAKQEMNYLIARLQSLREKSINREGG